MKKLLSVLVVLTMVLCASALAEDLSGTWYLTEGIMGELSINAASMGMDITIELNADGSAVITSNYEGAESEVQTGTWALSENGVTITSEGEPIELSLEDGKLCLRMDEESAMVFGRERVEAVALPAALAAESEEVFLGSWKATDVSMMGIVVPAEAAGMGMSMVVEPGKVTVDTGDGEPEVMDTAFADGAMTLTKDGELNGRLVLNDDGSISIEMDLGEDSVMAIYFAKAE